MSWIQDANGGDQYIGERIPTEAEIDAYRQPTEDHMDYNRFALLETEQADAQLLKRSCPFRDWHIVKPEVGEAIIVDSKRKAHAQAKKHAPAAIYQVR